MTQSLDRILSLEVPIIVRLGEARLPVREVIALTPGSIIELGKEATEPLDLLVNNKVVGRGSAVKVGENFGLRVGVIGDAKDRVRALGADGDPAAPRADPADVGAPPDDPLVQAAERVAPSGTG
jgi:flagellar motor switch protein FliN/FliY